MNYTKYQLKDNAELTELLQGRDNLFVVACNKCFQEFTTVDEPDCGEFQKLAATLGKNITGAVCTDFLCNKVQTERKWQDMVPAGTENVIVISCGLGVQTVADMAEIPTYAAADSLNYTGHHGMALTNKACGACAQCYLNVTGGICPVVDCSKSLLNGQCGGARDGKCEVDPDKDCAWEKICRRLEEQGRTKEFLAQPVRMRDYNQVSFEEVNKYITAIRNKQSDGCYGGVHPCEHKEYSEQMAIKRFPEPGTVVIPMGMHFGSPANPIVAAGDHVKVGQKIGELSHFISANVHSSVSGTVVAVEPRLHPVTGSGVMSVVIESDGKNELHESVVPAGPLSALEPSEIVEIVREKGITGMGGAGFPTYVKLMPGKPVDSVLINGCECEPMLTADHRLLLEYADDVIFGCRAIMKAVGAEKGYIVIEDNKPDAVEVVRAKVAAPDNIEVVVLRTKYPHGAEKILIRRVLNRKVPSGGLPADVGALVSNAGTAKAIADAITKGLPLIERVVSVTGERIRHPGNYIVKVGTNVQNVIDYCGGIVPGKPVTVKMGGPMMGLVRNDTDVPVIKGTNGIIAYDTDFIVGQECIKCGRCVDVCPVELEPLYFNKRKDDAAALKAHNIMDCIECRCCEYICSSKIPLVTLIRNGKKAVKGLK